MYILDVHISLHNFSDVFFIKNTFLSSVSVILFIFSNKFILYFKGTDLWIFIPALYWVSFSLNNKKAPIVFGPIII